MSEAPVSSIWPTVEFRADCSVIAPAVVTVSVWKLMSDAAKATAPLDESDAYNLGFSGQSF